MSHDPPGDKPYDLPEDDDKREPEPDDDDEDEDGEAFRGREADGYEREQMAEWKGLK